MGYENTDILNWIDIPRNNYILDKLAIIGKVGKTRVICSRTEEETTVIENKIKLIVDELKSELSKKISIDQSNVKVEKPIEYGIPLLDDLRNGLKKIKYKVKGNKGGIGSYVIHKKSDRNSSYVIKMIKAPQRRRYILEANFISFFYDNYISIPLLYDKTGNHMGSLYISENNKEEVLDYLIQLLSYIDKQLFEKIDVLFPTSPKWFKAVI